ncbi:hypothetical protein [Pararobbsia silviterrae]|uniref:Uncharacterized protein n=1 Tax=Pararobbsia silviterrae TaxID=1792498 RepID=A0A494Y5G7_9BURK|nr:hypothetical protein [Pararobbsia silviterrae]RKP56753.1 hypothetical protein D7S86_08295 [Pararobbsia silviterrae]
MELTLDDLATIDLHRGGHSGPDDGHCLLEVVAMFAGEPFSDNPQCVDPVLRSFGMAWNDGMRSDAERAQLKPYIMRLVGTRKSPELSQKRGWMAMDWLVRVHTAAWLALNPGLAHHADTLKALPPITCVAELKAAQTKLDEAKKDAAAAWAAAWAAARAVAWDAAWAAARAAAWAAARAAAWDAAGDAAGAAAWAAAGAAAWAAARAAAGDAAGAAAWDAAWAAAGAAAWAAAWAKLEPTVLALQTSAHELFSRMIDAA